MVYWPPRRMTPENFSKLKLTLAVCWCILMLEIPGNTCFGTTLGSSRFDLLFRVPAGFLALIQEKRALMSWESYESLPIWLSGAILELKMAVNSTFWRAYLRVTWTGAGEREKKPVLNTPKILSNVRNDDGSSITHPQKLFSRFQSRPGPEILETKILKVL